MFAKQSQDDKHLCCSSLVFILLPLVLWPKTKNQVKQNSIYYSPTQHYEHLFPPLWFTPINMKAIQNIETSHFCPIWVLSKSCVCMILVQQKTFIRICHCGNLVHPLPITRNIMSIQEVATEQEEEGSECNDCCVTQYIVWHHWAHKHHERVCWEEGNIESNQEIYERSAELQSTPHNDSIDCSLNGKERKVSYDTGNCVRRGSICIVGSLSDEYESLLNEAWDSVVGWEEEEADSEDEEADAVCDSL